MSQPQDLLEVEEARMLLKMPRENFERLIVSEQLPVFRASGKTCVRRQHVAELASKRQPKVSLTVPSKTQIPVTATAPRKAPADSAQAAAPVRIPLSAKPRKPIVKSAEVTKSSRKTPRHPRRLMAVCLIGTGILIALSLAAYSYSHAHTPDAVPVLALSSAPATITTAAPGLVESSSGIRNLSFEVAGKIKSVCVDEGQSVRKGQLVAELENDDMAARLESARAELGASEAKLKITERNLKADLIQAQKEFERLKADLALLEAGPRKEQIDAARAEADSARAEAKRTADDEQKYFDPSGKFANWSKQLYDQAHGLAAVAAAKFDAAKARVRELEAGTRKEEIDKAHAALASADANVARQETTMPFQLELSRQQVAEARAQVSNAQAELNKTRLYSPLDGKVVWKFLREGEAIDGVQHQPVVAVADMTHLQVRASVDEADYPRIVRGQRVRITTDAFKGQSFTGCVDLVCSSAGQKSFSTGEAKERQDVRVIETLISLDPPSPLKLGLRVTVYFEEPHCFKPDDSTK